MSLPTTPAFFQDEVFQDRLIKVLSQDPIALKQCATLLKTDDFKPLKGMQFGRPRWVVAERVLSYYKRFQQPVGKLLRADVLEYASRTGLGERQIKEIDDYLQYLRKIPANSPDAVCEKVIHFKEERIKASVIDELGEAHAAGTLTNSVWQTLSSKVLNIHGIQKNTSDYFSGLESRIAYRDTIRNHGTSKIPCFMIDPLDALVRGVGPGELGLIIAPTNRGKSLALMWLSIMFCLQGLNVMFVTLEDPREELESRLDAAVTGLQIRHLANLPKTLRARFQHFRTKHNLMNGRLKIVDGTSEGMSVAQMDEAVMSERNNGFRVDALIVDFDEEIVPVRKQKEYRFEVADTYRDMRRLLAQHNMVGWLAAQTQRGTEKLKILSGSKVAEDIGKIRKSTMVISLGQGDWGSESFYLWVDKHKFDVKHVGCHIVPDLSRMLLYDREATRKAKLRYDTQEDEYEEEE